MNVLYFTVTPLMDSDNGGSICCRNHVLRLTEDPAIKRLIAVAAGPAEWKEGTQAFFDEIGVEVLFQPIIPWRIWPEDKGFVGLINFLVRIGFQFDWELQSINQSHINEGIDWAIRYYNIDTLIMDYHPSAMFVKLPRSDVRTLLIGLNREGDFYEDRVRLGATHHGIVSGIISIWRARLKEHKINKSVDKLITISRNDFPKRKLQRLPTYITPHLDKKRSLWRYCATKRALFVGRIGHYPNKKAIEWITSQLAPALLELDKDIRLTIVGAYLEDIPEPYRFSNLEFFGPSSSDTLAELFRESDLVICPIENDYGVKFKALEALSYGAPLLASHATLAGLRHLRDMPVIDLKNPTEAACILNELINSPDKLISLHKSQIFQQDEFAESQKCVWSNTISSIPPR